MAPTGWVVLQAASAERRALRARRVRARALEPKVERAAAAVVPVRRVVPVVAD
jgi:hypothetical protein